MDICKNGHMTHAKFQLATLMKERERERERDVLAGYSLWGRDRGRGRGLPAENK